MIVRCKKCGTKYRFDESILEGHGGWVRCSRCGEVFFIDHPSMDEASIGPDTSSPGVLHAEIQMTVRQDLQKEAGMNADDREELPVSVVPGGPEKYLADERGMDPEIEEDQKNLKGFNGTLSDTDTKQQATKQMSKGRAARVNEEPVQTGMKWWILFISILLLGVVYLWFFFEIGNQVAGVMSSTVSMVMERIQGANIKGGDDGLAQVQLTDLRQRFVTNVQIGSLRIVEGTAANESSHPMTRIKVRGELVGADGILLGEMTSYCGNLITDQELSGMTEEQILKELSNPLGSDISNDQIAVKGQIPFMLVFTHEPPGVMKTFVIPAQAERLLP
jgi:predicted Zn finger-like uncharacterized protein